MLDVCDVPEQKEQEMLGDPCLASLKKGEIIQLQRRGYFICDQPYLPARSHTSLLVYCILLFLVYFLLVCCLSKADN